MEGAFSNLLGSGTPNPLKAGQSSSPGYGLPLHPSLPAKPFTPAHDPLPHLGVPTAYARHQGSPSSTPLSSTSPNTISLNQLSPAFPFSSDSQKGQSRPRIQGERGISFNKATRGDKRIGGPPKAVLGGPGGKPWDERLSLSPSSSRTQSKSPMSETLISDSNANEAQSATEGRDAKHQWKGANISVKLPPFTYSPPETPTKHKQLAEETGQFEGEISGTVKKPRKVSRPWPKSRRVESASKIPLPDSPKSRTGKSINPQGNTKPEVTTETALPGTWRGKEILVAIPKHDAWKGLFAATDDPRPASLDYVYESHSLPSVPRNEGLGLSDVETASVLKNNEDGLAEMNADSSSWADLPSTLTASARRLGSSAFLKRSLGGILRESPVRQSRVARPAVSDIFATAIVTDGDTNAIVPADQETARPARTSSSPVFEDIPLAANKEDTIDRDSTFSNNDTATSSSLNTTKYTDNEAETSKAAPRESLDQPSQTPRYSEFSRFDLKTSGADAPTIRPSRSCKASVTSTINALESNSESTVLRPSAATFIPGHGTAFGTSVPSTASTSAHSQPLSAQTTGERIHRLRPDAGEFQPAARHVSYPSQSSSIGSIYLAERAFSLPASRLHGDAPAFEPASSRDISHRSSPRKTSFFSDIDAESSFNTSTDTDTTGSVAKLKPTAKVFVPTQQQLALATLEPLEVLYYTSVQEEDATRLHTREEQDDISNKKARLRPTAAAFVPPPKPKPRYYGADMNETVRKAPVQAGPKLAPGTIQFKPTLRPSATAFVPSRPASLKHQTESHTSDSAISPPRQVEHGETLPEFEFGNDDSIFANQSTELSTLVNAPADTRSEERDDPRILAWRDQASPRDAIQHNWDAVDDEEIDDEQRPNRMTRRNSTRSNENSHLPQALASLPRNDADFTVSEMAIHPSHPFHTPIIASRTLQGTPDVPISARTHKIAPSPSQSPPKVPQLPVLGDLDLDHVKPPRSAFQSANGLQELVVDEIPDPFAFTPEDDIDLKASGSQGSPLSHYSHSTPAKGFNPQTTPKGLRHVNSSMMGNDTFTTADGSPLVPNRLYTISHSPELPSLPRDSFPPDPIPDYPFLEEQALSSERNFSKPEIIVDGAKDDLRFREWVFPLHGRKPSLYRRHTMPSELSPDLFDEPTFGAGIASTSFAERVGSLRAYLAGHGDERGQDAVIDSDDDRTQGKRISRESTNTSVEFPIRTDSKLLKVVNDAPSTSRLLSPARQYNELRNHAETPTTPSLYLDQILHAIQNVQEQLRSANSTQVHKLQDILVEGISSGFTNLVSEMDTRDVALEDIRTSIQTVLQQQSINSAQSESDGDDVPGSSDVRSQEMFASMLTGQHAILNKLSEMSEGHNDISGMIARLQQSNDEMADHLARQVTENEESTGLREQLEETRSVLKNSQRDNAETQASLDGLVLEDLARQAEVDLLKSRLKQSQMEIESMKNNKDQTDSQLDLISARQIAAENERDSLSKSLLDARDDMEKMSAQMQQLRLETENLRAERDHAFEDVKSATAAKAVKIRDEEKAANASNAAFQQTLLEKLSVLEHSIVQTKGGDPDNQRVIGENGDLREENKTLKQQLEGTAREHTAFKISQAKLIAEIASDRDSIKKSLATDREAKEKIDRQLQESNRKLEEAQREASEAKILATERQTFARMSEVRLQAISQEAIYWRQFALEADRKKYRSYMASAPFQSNSPPDADIQTPEMTNRGSQQEPDTPTRKTELNGGKSLTEEGRETEAHGESHDSGTWYGLST